MVNEDLFKPETIKEINETGFLRLKGYEGHTNPVAYITEDEESIWVYLHEDTGIKINKLTKDYYVFGIGE